MVHSKNVHGILCMLEFCACWNSKIPHDSRPGRLCEIDHCTRYAEGFITVLLLFNCQRTDQWLLRSRFDVSGSKYTITSIRGIHDDVQVMLCDMHLMPWYIGQHRTAYTDVQHNFTTSGGY